jgi:hypothetical protein
LGLLLNRNDQEFRNKQASRYVWLSLVALIARGDRLWTLQAGLNPGLSERFSSRAQRVMISIRERQLEQVRSRESLFTL